MSTDFARVGAAFPGCMYKLHIDCSREIDFDFFDESPSLPSTPWRKGSPAGQSRSEGEEQAEEDDVVVATNGALPPHVMRTDPQLDSGNITSGSSLTSTLSAPPVLTLELAAAGVHKQDQDSVVDYGHGDREPVHQIPPPIEPEPQEAVGSAVKGDDAVGQEPGADISTGTTTQVRPFFVSFP